jgi:hypothetical protein
MRRRRLFCLSAATLVLLTAGAAQAAPQPNSRADTRSERGPARAEPGRGGLPFSGLDVALLAAGGGPLLLIGVSLRRRQPKAASNPVQEETLTLA